MAGADLPPPEWAKEKTQLKISKIDLTAPFYFF